MLFLPRPAQLAAPAGSFVEAVEGKADPAPKPAAIENATGLLRRLLASGDAVALNLLGTAGHGTHGRALAGGQPDFVATEETLPFLFALRGDREWTRGPRGKSSPLVVEVWKALGQGPLTADEVKDRLGRQLTETAALRALAELWAELRIEPVHSNQAGARWQRLEAGHEKAMAAGSAMGHAGALSAMVSVYLQTAVAATEDEMEAFLSPLASRSRIRDAVRGLLATRQLGLSNLGAGEHFFVEGSLPEFADPLAGPLPDPLADPLADPFRPAAPAAEPVAGRGERAESRSAAALIAQTLHSLPDLIPDLLPETAAPAGIVIGGGELRIEALSASETEQERGAGEGRKRFVAQRAAQAGERKSFAPRPGGQRKGFGGERKSFGEERKTFSRGPREGAGAAGKPFHAREPWKEDRRPVQPAGEGRPSGGERGSFGPSGAGRAPASRGDRKPFSKPFSGDVSGGGKPFRKEGAGKSFAPRTAGAGPRKPFVSREGARPFSAAGEGKPFAPREDARPRSGPGPRSGERKPFAPRQGKPFAPREGARPFAPGGDRRPFAPREGSPSSSRAGLGADARKPFAPRPGARPFSAGRDRKPFVPREGGRPGAAGRPFSPASPGSSGSDRKPFAPREEGSPGRRTFAPRGEGRSFSPRAGSPRAGGAGTPFRRNPGSGSDGEAPPRRTGAPGTGGPGAAKRFSPGSVRPARPGAPAGSGKRPRTSPFTSSGKPRAGASAAGRPGPRAGARPGAAPGARPASRSTRPAGTGKPASGRKPGAGPRKPGGPGTPGGKPPRRDG